MTAVASAPETGRDEPKIRRELPGWLPGLLGTVAILIAWQLIAVLWGGEKHVVASPTEILQTLHKGQRVTV